MRFQNKLLVARRRQLGDKLNFILPLKVLSFLVKLFCVNNTLINICLVTFLSFCFDTW